MKSDKYIEYLVNDYIDKNGYLNASQIKRKQVAIEYFAFIMTLNGIWKIVTKKRIAELEKQFKDMTIKEICNHINNEIKVIELITTNDFTQNIRNSFMAGKGDDDKKTLVKLTPIVQFKVGEHQLYELPTVKIVAADVNKEKKK
jgi:hypothetical protein